MDKCACCGKDAINLVKVGKMGMCCEYCESVLLMEIAERKSEKEGLDYNFLDSQEKFVYSDGEKVSEKAILFYAKDFRGKRHVFSIHCMSPLEGMVTYIAREVYEKKSALVTEYEFEVYGSQEMKSNLIAELLLKTAKGINNTTLEHGTGMPSVKQTGDMQVIYSEKYRGKYGWKIDGKNYSPEEAMSLFYSYEGWRFLFQATDSSDDVIDKDSLLMPIVMNEKTFVDELYELIMIFSDHNRGDFISYKNIFGFDIMFDKLIEKLQYYFLHNPRGIGKLVGMKMISMLEDIDTDDDTFPEYQIMKIRDAISKNEEFNHPETPNTDAEN